MAVTDHSRHEGPGRQIAARRTALGMSIKALAERSGVHRDTISAIERGGGQTPRGATVGAITSALDRFEEEAGTTSDQTPTDVDFFLDVMGLFLSALPESERQQLMRDITRQIVGR